MSEFNMDGFTVDDLRVAAPSDFSAWPDLLKTMSWDIEHFNPSFTSVGDISFFVIDDSGASIPVLFVPFMWMGEDDDPLANSLFAIAEKLSRVEGVDVLLLYKLPMVFNFDAYPDGINFSSCGRFLSEGKWVDIFLNKSQGVDSLYRQARHASPLPEAYLEDSDSFISLYICKRQGKVMKDLGISIGALLPS